MSETKRRGATKEHMDKIRVLATEARRKKATEKKEAKINEKVCWSSPQERQPNTSCHSSSSLHGSTCITAEHQGPRGLLSPTES